MSLALWREFYRPHTKRCVDLAKEFGVRVMHHDDGAMRAFLPDLLDLGIDLLNPVQWACPGMELAALKRDFGGRVAFHGGVENQRILPFGTPEEVRAEVRHCIDELASDGTGYILCPCHNLQAGTPVENILAMYDEARRYGATK
jgi:uroporphyrinogen decarboxylase